MAAIVKELSHWRLRGCSGFWEWAAGRWPIGAQNARADPNLVAANYWVVVWAALCRMTAHPSCAWRSASRRRNRFEVVFRRLMGMP